MLSFQGSASETTFVALLAAKDKTVRALREINPELTEAEIKGKLVAYSSNQSNSSVEKAGLLGSMQMRLLQCDDEGQLRGDVLLEAIREDQAKGLIPCYVVANLGTTPTCAFDKLEEIGPICNRENIWLHIDAAYAGTAFICPEYRHLMNGVEYADSFNFNPHKWMLVNFDCSAMWVKDAKYLVEAFNVDRIYLKDNHKGLAPEYRHWQIALGRRFRALKLWFVLRIYGVEGIQKHVRDHVALAKYFEQLVRADQRFEVCASSMGLVCFKLKGDDDSLTVKLIDRILERKNIYLVTGHFNNMHVVRFAICGRLTERKHIDFAWNEFSSQADDIFSSTTIANAVTGEKPKNVSTIEISNGGCQKIEEKSK